MKKSKLLSILLLLSFIASPLIGTTPKAEAQSVQVIPAASAPQAEAPQPNDELGVSNTSGQQRSTTMAMRIAAALGQNRAQSGSAARYAGINPDTAQYSPLGKVGGALAEMLPNINLPDYFGFANFANSPWPQLNASGAVVPGTGIRKFVETLPLFCGQPGGTNGLGQCVPVGIPDTTTFPGSDYYEIAAVEYREQLSLDLPAPGTKLRGYVQVVPANFPGAVPLTTANGLTMNIIDRNGLQVYGAYKPHYLGPMLIVQGCDLVINPTTCHPIPVRVKFTNYLATGPAGALFIPTDSTYMGAGMGPGGSIYSISVTNGGTGYTTAPAVVFSGGAGTGAAATATVINGTLTAITVNQGGSAYTSAPTVSFSGGGGTGAAATAVLAGQPGEMYTQNRATLHLHGGDTPWISDGTPHQWTTPYGELTSYSKGDSVAYVPDMWFDANGNLYAPCAGQLACPGYSNDPGLGSLSFYWTNQESGRLLFYHDHSYGITRLNVYAGEAAGYLIASPVEEASLLAGGFPGTIPDVHNLATADLAHLIPLIIQDKTFVPDSGAAGGQLALTDPTWDTTVWGSAGDLWFPHVYTPNQNPADITGANAFGRWDYGPWFWPPQDPSTFVPSGQPYQCTSVAYPPGSPPAFPPLICPGTPNPSGTPEGFMDTPLINGTTYPTLTVDPTAYRFQVLSVGNDRSWNLQLYVAEPLAVAVTNGGANYTLPPIIGFTGGGGTGATATANMSNGSVTSILLTSVGMGYTITPNVTISGNGTGATAVAVIDPVTTTISSIRITNGGYNYTSATVVIDPPLGCTSGCLTATAVAVVTPPGSVMSVLVTNPGSGYTSNPTVTFTNAPGDTTGAGAAGISSINSEVKMVESAPPEPDSELPLCQETTQTSGAQLALATLDATGQPINGTGLPAGCWPTTWPTDGRDGGVPDPLSAGPPIIQIGTESGLLPAPVIIPSTPVGYEYNRRSITVLNVYTHGLLLGPAERADIIIDFAHFAGKTLLLYNDSPTPNPGFDPRMDYYTGDLDQTIAGGAPTTLPGYGPNTRTIMQIKVNAAGGVGGGPLGGVTVTNVGAGYTAPTVAIAGGGGTGAAATATGSVDSVTLTNAGTGYVNPVITFSGGGGSGASAIFASGAVSGLTLTAPGAGYTSMPLITFTGGGGTLAAATAYGSVDTVALTAGGTGYATTAVGFTGGGGSGATATATGAVNAIAVNNGGGGYATIPTVTLTGGGGTGATASATGGVDAVAITNAGGGYATMPTITFSGGGGSGAAATATGAVDAIAVTTAGVGYHIPVVTLTGNATATAHGSVDGLVVVNGGTGYTAPVVTLTGGGGTGATATALVTGGVITGFTITNPGTGYTSAPTVTITDVGPGTGATAAATQTLGVITLVTPGAGGTGYLNPVVTVTDSGGLGTGAIITAQQTGGVITGYTIVNGGTGYVTPVLTITDAGLGTGASATSAISIATITVTAAGSGYATAPTVTITDSGGTPTTPAAATATLKVNAVTVSAAGTLYTTAPTVTFSAGLATGTATLLVNAIAVTAAGTGYTAAPAVVFSSGTAVATATLTITTLTLGLGGTGYSTVPTVTFTGGGTGATATDALWVTSLVITSPGSGYTSAPTVSFSGGGGTGAAATASISATGITLTNGGSGYTSAPLVTITDTPPGGGTGATAVATINVKSITLTNPGTGYTSIPAVTIADTPPGAGHGATAVAFMAAGTPINLPLLGTTVTNLFTTQQGRIIIPEPQFPAGNGGSATSTYSRIEDTSFTGWFNGQIGSVTLTNGGSGYSSAPSASFTGGGGMGGTLAVTFAGATVNTLTLVSGGSGYSTAPAVTLSGGGGTGAAATAFLNASVVSVTVTNGGRAYRTPPTVVFTGGGGTGATATATIQGGKVTAVTVTNGGTGYTSVPAVSFSGGGGSGAAATAAIAGPVGSLLLTNGGSGYTSNPTVSFSGGGGTGAAATATYLPGTVISLVVSNQGTGYTSAPTIVFSGGGTPSIPAAAVANPPLIGFKAKAIQELFTLDYGRMNATLGVELPFTNFFIQTTIPYGYIDPPTELVTNNEVQIWKITHNGVDTHFIHFHLYDVQVINRVGWDGMIKPPDVNEVAWKDTVRMNPLEDIIVALRPMKQTLPFEIPNSIRPMDVTQSIGVSNPNNTFGFANIDPGNNPVVVNNDVINYGWEYVVHCHILGHEENDMMRSEAFAIPPDPVSNVTATRFGTGTAQYVVITWVDGSSNETGFTVQRATAPGGPWLSLTPSAPPAPGRGTAMSYTDNTVSRYTTYYYQVVANNVVGYTQTYAAPAVGYPTFSADSVPVQAPAPVTILSEDVPGPIFADSFETGLNLWSGIIGESNVITNAVLGPNGGKLGMVSKLSAAQPSYVYDLMPNAEVMYDANFYFNPHTAINANPVDIFLGIDQLGEPIFGIQFKYIDANSYELRAWVMHADGPEFSDWIIFASEPGDDDPVIRTHKINVGWMSDLQGGFSFYVDDRLAVTMIGDTSAFQLEEVILGPALGMSTDDTGSMFFDEFTSSRLVGVSFVSYLPTINK